MKPKNKQLFIILCAYVLSGLQVLTPGPIHAKKKADDRKLVKPNTPFKPEKNRKRNKVVSISRSLINNNKRFLHRNGKTYPNDCSGMVRAVFDSMGIDVFYKASQFRGENGVAIIYKTYKTQSWSNPRIQPRPGDLIIFNNTYDKNRNKKWDDKYTHVSIVTGVEADGTIAFIHHVSKGIRRYRMNFQRKTVYTEGGKKYNDFLRRRPKSDPDRTKYLSVNFFQSYVRILDSKNSRMENNGHFTPAETPDQDFEKFNANTGFQADNQKNNSREERRKRRKQRRRIKKLKREIKTMLLKYDISEEQLIEMIERMQSQKRNY